MAIGQDQPVVPPVSTDKFLMDFANLIQRNFSTLFQAAHYHINARGPITSAPKTTDGNPGDILVGDIGGNVYLFVKIDRSHWYRFGPGTAV